MCDIRCLLSIWMIWFSCAVSALAQSESRTEPENGYLQQPVQVLAEQEWIPWLVWLTESSPEFEFVPWHSAANPRELLHCGLVVLSEMPDGLEDRMRLERIQAQGALLVEIEDGRRLPWWSRMEKNIAQIARAMSERWPDREPHFQKQRDVLLNWIRMGKRIEWQKCRDAEKQAVPLGGQMIQVGSHVRRWHRVITLVLVASVDVELVGFV